MKKLIKIFFVLFIVTGCTKGESNIVKVAEGEFIFSSNDKKEEKVFLKSFSIDKYEVSSKEYKVFTDETKRKKPSNWRTFGYKEEYSDFPIIYVTYNDALAFCEHKGKTLPTSKQWQKAASGKEGNVFPWGNSFERNKSNSSLSNVVGTEKVNSYEEGVSPYGLYNMSGNVMEWVKTKGKARDTYIAMGGSWGITHNQAKTYSFVELNKDKAQNNLGFRCVKN